MKIAIKSPWRGRRRLFAPGDYAVPGELTATEARCCMADGAGEIVKEAAEKAEPFRDSEPASAKQPAPENKQRGAAPENKAEVERGRRGGGKRAKPDEGSGSQD